MSRIVLACLAAPILVVAAFALGLQISVWSEGLFVLIGAKPLTADVLSMLSGYLSACSILGAAVAVFFKGQPS